MEQQDDLPNLKMVLLGDVAVGKTSLSHRFVANSFLINSESTVRIAFQSKNLSFVDESGAEVQLNLRIWDTAGQEKYRSLAPLYIRGADVALIVYDVTSRESSETVGFWLEELRQSGEDLVVAVVGNKIDTPAEREVTAEQGRLIAQSCGNALFQETSARTGDGVESVFVKAAQAGWEKKKVKDLRKAGVRLGGEGGGASSGSKCGC